MALKYQIFISSTYDDLNEERDAVIKAVLEMGHIPVGMEMFSAADEEQWKMITRQIDFSDYYVVIVAHRYGSVVDGVSYTEKEYDYAAAKGVPILGFIIDEKAPWPANKSEKDKKKQAALDAFKAKVKSKIINFWKNADDLHPKVVVSLMKSFTTHPRPGWVRSTEVVGSEVLAEISRLSKENSDLRDQINELERSSEEEQAGKLGKLTEVLKKNKVSLKIRKSITVKLDEAPIYHTTLKDLFEAISTEIYDEATEVWLGKYIGRVIAKDHSINFDWPIAQNLFRIWLADMAALELVAPSPKRHSVNDKNRYWSLTQLGKDFIAYSRRKKLGM